MTHIHTETEGDGVGQVEKEEIAAGGMWYEVRRMPGMVWASRPTTL